MVNKSNQWELFETSEAIFYPKWVTHLKLLPIIGKLLQTSNYLLLPPAYVVRRQVMFSQVCVCSGGWSPSGPRSFSGGIPYSCHWSCPKSCSRSCRGISQLGQDNPPKDRTGSILQTRQGVSPRHDRGYPSDRAGVCPGTGQGSTPM